MLTRREHARRAGHRQAGEGGFLCDDLEASLRGSGITQRILAGVNTKVCVHTGLRGANDLGFECLVPEDGTASNFPESHRCMKRRRGTPRSAPGHHFNVAGLIGIARRTRQFPQGQMITAPNAGRYSTGAFTGCLKNCGDIAREVHGGIV
jgi:hypothetical protein